MTKVIAEITVSLDGFVTGPNADVDHGLGVGGEPLHRWVMESDDPVDSTVRGRAGASTSLRPPKPARPQ